MIERRMNGECVRAITGSEGRVLRVEGIQHEDTKNPKKGSFDKLRMKDILMVSLSNRARRKLFVSFVALC